MASIQILDTHTINKIAAGEVVERPSSVVKELVENSIDAKASSITVEIKNGGVDLIRVTDNGVGIPKDQVEIAFLRHATSKITSAEDLYEVTSLGFRGEALASIAAVSHVELLTKEVNDLTGKRIEVSGGKITSSAEVACPNGTTFMMRHLFFNVPARKAFLNSSTSEAGRVSDYMYKLSLAHPEISFKYIQNGKTVFTTSGDHELTHCVLNIYGREYAKNTVPCYYQAEGVVCAGLVGKPVLNRGNRNYEHFFVNGRYIKSQLLQGAVEDAYKTLVMVGKFPFVVLHLTIAPAQVDVNVHPNKLQVRFKNVDGIYKAVFEAVSHALKEAYLVPQIEPDKPKTEIKPSPATTQMEVDTFFAPRKENNTPTPETMIKHSFSSIPQKPNHQSTSIGNVVERLFGEGIEPRGDSTYQIKEADAPLQKPVEIVDIAADEKDDISQKVCEKPESFESKADETPSQEEMILPTPITDTPIQNTPTISPSDYRIVGELFKTFWIIQYHEKVFIIDQHAAHERVLYEQFMKCFRANEVATQLLLLPETFHITPMEKALLEEHQDLFTKLGFKYEAFGEQAIAIREVPFILNEPLSPGVFKEVLDTLSQGKLSDITDIKAEAIIRMACRSAIKAHDQISVAECHKLIEQLLSLGNPFTCPHGRPTLVALTQADIEKMFKRI